jgi:hypothetical protein
MLRLASTAATSLFLGKGRNRLREPLTMLYRVLSIVVTLAPLLLLGKLKDRLLGRDGARSVFLYKLMIIWGVGPLDDAQLTYLGMGAAIYSFAFGFVMDLMLRERALGGTVNGILGFLGAAAAVTALLSYPVGQIRGGAALCFVGLAGSTLLVFVACVAKLAVIWLWEHVFIQPVARPAPSKVPRVDAVIQRRR